MQIVVIVLKVLSAYKITQSVFSVAAVIAVKFSKSEHYIYHDALGFEGVILSGSVFLRVCLRQCFCK